MSYFFIILVFILCILLALLCKIYQTRLAYGGKLHQKTYSLTGDNGLNYGILRQMLKEKNFTEVSTSEPYVDLAWGDYIAGNFEKYGSCYDPKFITQHSNLKNILSNLKQVGNKDLMFLNMKKYVPEGLKFLPKTELFSNFLHQIQKNLLNFPLIIKDSTGLEQMGITIVSNIDELHKLKHKKEKAVICEYIANPLLIYGLKFNLRCYYLLYSKGKYNNCYTHSDYQVLTASKPYVNNNYADTDIHLSGGYTHHKRYFWPTDFFTMYNKSLLKICQSEINACNTMVCKLLSSVDIKSYSESKAGFKIFCADLLITDEGKVYLLEINTRCGMSPTGEENGKKEYLDQFSEHFFKWVLNIIIDKM